MEVIPFGRNTEIVSIGKEVEIISCQGENRCYTVMQGIEVLRRWDDAVHSIGKITAWAFRLPSGEELWNSTLRFRSRDDLFANLICVLLEPSSMCTAFLNSKRIKLSVGELDGAIVDLDGKAMLKDGRFIFGIEMKPTHRTTGFSELEEKTLRCIIDLSDAEKSCLGNPFRGYIENFEPQIIRHELVNLKRVVANKQILAVFEEKYKGEKPPSSSTISKIQKECGIKKQKKLKKADTSKLSLIG